ncbi:MAG: hypothetical protein KDN20_02060 [Verrucomicrobiae bacterium]|nr:hypothetical protein [Verrucomicrobiae bacterium]
MISKAIFFAAVWTAGLSEGVAQEDWVFLDNGEIRLGVNRSAGAAIGWFSESGKGVNLLNHYDHGRYLQQSWYGDADGSDWNGKPWVWNPVQGGGWRGEPAETLELIADSATALSAKTRPTHWATGKPIDDVIFEQWITLEGPVARVHFRMTYTGEKVNQPRHQELPAVFINDQLTTLVHYDGDAPWTGAELSKSEPGWPNERREITEHWAAYIDPATNRGVGVYVPVADTITCYRFSKPGAKGACSYFAPVKTMAIVPGFTFEYEIYLTKGTPEAMRNRFAAIHRKASDKGKMIKK